MKSASFDKHAMPQNEGPEWVRYRLSALAQHLTARPPATAIELANSLCRFSAITS